MVGATAEVGPTGLRALKPGEGIEAVQGFCRGLNALDEFSDVASSKPEVSSFGSVSCKLMLDLNGLND